MPEEEDDAMWYNTIELGRGRFIHALRACFGLLQVGGIEVTMGDPAGSFGDTKEWFGVREDVKLAMINQWYVRDR